MSETVDLKRTIYGKNTFSTVVDVNFKELLPVGADESENEVSVDKFFDMYNTLFFEIPVDGELSHTEILNRSGDYIGQPYSELLQEVEALKQENAELKNQIDTLTR